MDKNNDIKIMVNYETIRLYTNLIKKTIKYESEEFKDVTIEYWCNRIIEKTQRIEELIKEGL